MSKIVSRVLSFLPSAGAASYNIYKHGAASEPAYTDPHVNVPPPVPGTDGRVSVDLVTLDLFKAFEGTVDVGVTALDAAGNESDFMDIDSVVFDFSPPQAPTAGRVD